MVNGWRSPLSCRPVAVNCTQEGEVRVKDKIWVGGGGAGAGPRGAGGRRRRAARGGGGRGRPPPPGRCPGGGGRRRESTGVPFFYAPRHPVLRRRGVRGGCAGVCRKDVLSPGQPRR